jgi:hypothetical protein
VSLPEENRRVREQIAVGIKKLFREARFPEMGFQAGAKSLLIDGNAMTVSI